MFFSREGLSRMFSCITADYNQIWISISKCALHDDKKIISSGNVQLDTYISQRKAEFLLNFWWRNKNLRMHKAGMERK